MCELHKEKEYYLNVFKENYISLFKEKRAAFISSLVNANVFSNEYINYLTEFAIQQDFPSLYRMVHVLDVDISDAYNNF